MTEVKLPSFQTPGGANRVPAATTLSSTSAQVVIPAQFRPTLAVDASWDDFARILQEGHALYASPKLDGIRCVIKDGIAYSRTLKPIRNDHVQQTLRRLAKEGYDGELVVGPAYGEEVFNRTSRGVMSGGGTPDFTYWVFDNFTLRGRFDERLLQLMEDLRGDEGQLDSSPVKLLAQRAILKLEELQEAETAFVDQGYEGAILRLASAPYKFGRSTLRERYMLKLKRFMDGEARIIGFQEKFINANEATRDARGYQVRGSSKEGKIPANTLGALIVEDLKNKEWIFNVGTGMDDSLRAHIWARREQYEAKIIKYRYLPVGTKDLPRHPSLVAFIDPELVDTTP